MKSRATAGCTGRSSVCRRRACGNREGRRNELRSGEDISHDMPDKAVYLLVVEGFADWEPAHAVAELRRNGNYRVESVGLAREPVASMGGIRVLPSKVVGEVDPSDVAVFILPGGDRWENAAGALGL